MSALNPQTLGAEIARLLVFAALAVPGAYLLRLANPERPAGAAMLILYFGMLLVSGTLRLRRWSRRTHPDVAAARLPRPE